jgi:hypothetical protein
MVKSLERIQQENRRLILETILEGNNLRLLKENIGDFSGARLDLSRVLFALPKNIGFIAEVCPYDNRNLIIKKSYYSEDYCVWDLTKQTLEEQSEKTQREINEMKKMKKIRITFEDEANNQKIIIESEPINLQEMIATLEDALRRSGFYFKGHLEIVEDEE